LTAHLSRRSAQEPGGFPIFLTLAGQAVLIVGDGAEAVGKLVLVARAGAAATVVSAAPTEALLGAVAEYGATLRHRSFLDADLAGMRLCFVALDVDPARDAEAAAIVAEARSRHVPVNAVDRPALCDFIVPAIIDRAPVTIAVSTAGAAPVLARDLRRRIEAMVPPAYSQLALFFRRWRVRVAAVLPDAGRRRRFWDAVIDGPEAAAVLQGDEGRADRALGHRLAAAEVAARLPLQGQVSLVGVGPGDPELLTLKALRTLQQADVILYDRSVDPRILDLARRGARRLPLDGPAAGAAGDHARAGAHVVWLTAGDPLACDTADLAGLPVEIVPGIGAVEAAAAAERTRQSRMERE
jgi:uroporphyrin-III C-methyltransferase/precorrin-2 dehydrogenase/sirohydrochlorin ferrochelatase